jgi:hypothetical protein
MNTIKTAAACLALASFAASSNAVVSFFDGTFNNADWNLTTYTNPNGFGSSQNGFQLPVGGNPTQYRLVRNNLVIGGPNSLDMGIHINNTFSYNPGSSGAITSINYSEDSKNFVNQGGGGQGTGLAIAQGGRFYVVRTTILSMPYSGFSNWAPNSLSGIVASDLYEATPAGTFISGSNPDFSASGGVMQFGFFRGNSSGTSTLTQFNTECGIDNWHVDIIPAPGAVALLGMGGLIAGRRRRG